MKKKYFDLFKTNGFDTKYIIKFNQSTSILNIQINKLNIEKYNFTCKSTLNYA